MSTLAYAARDSRTMLRRNLRHMWRYPSLTLMVAGLPVIFLLLFVYVFGGTLGNGLGGPSGGRAQYLTYVAPGILLMTVAGVAQGTAISVAMDMTEGIVARFRTMAIFRPSILTGHVLSAMTQTACSLAIVVGVALLIGFRPTASPVEWAAAVGILALISLAVTWLSVACGLVSKTVEAASNLPMPLLLLPFLGSGFVPADSMPTALRWFAEYQPFTPVIETLRACCWAPPSAAARSSPSPGAPSSPWSATCGLARPSTATPGPRQPDRSSRERPAHLRSGAGQASRCQVRA